MSKKTVENKKSIDGILSMLNILRIVTNIDEFEKWLKEYHKNTLDEKLLEGYRFFVTTIFRWLIEEIMGNSSLGVKEDYTLFRAGWKGIYMEYIPNTCEKTIFVKNIWKVSKLLRRAKGWKEIKRNTKNKKLEEVFELFDGLYNISYLSLELNKEEAIRTVTTFYTYFLGKISKNGIPIVPVPYIHVFIIPISKAEEYYIKAFEGYAITLEFLWFKLLGKEEFKNSCVRNLHKAFEIFKEKAYKEIEFKPEMEKLRKYKDWIALDYFRPEIEKEILDPIENKLKIDLPFEPLFLVNSIPKEIFKEFLRKEGIEEPPYMKSKNEEEIKEWLDSKLFWYKVEVLASTGEIFSGIHAFILILTGAVESKENNEKVYVKVFKHPEKEGYNYSYGVLIPAFGGISDYSGWIIFFDCATDYSGFGGSLYAQAKIPIEQFKDSLDVEEIEVDKTTFKNYLKKVSASSVFDRIIVNDSLLGPHPLDIYSTIEEYERQYKQLTENAKGILFELIVYKWLNENKDPNFNDFDKLKHEKIIDDEEEIDIFGVKNDKGYLFECKVALHKRNNEEELPKKIIKKKELLEQKEQVSSVEPVLVTYTQLRSDDKNYFEEKGIRVVDNFKKKIIENLFIKSISTVIINVMEEEDKNSI